MRLFIGILIVTLFYACTPTSIKKVEQMPNPLENRAEGLWVAVDNINSSLWIKNDTLYQWTFGGDILSTTSPLFRPFSFSYNDSLSLYSYKLPGFQVISPLHYSLSNDKSWTVSYDDRAEQLLLMTKLDTFHYEFLTDKTIGITSPITNWRTQIEANILQEENQEGVNAYCIFTDSTFVLERYEVKKISPFSGEERFYTVSTRLDKKASDYQDYRDHHSMVFNRFQNLLFVTLNLSPKPAVYLVKSIQKNQMVLSKIGQGGEDLYWNKVEKPSKFLQEVQKKFTENMVRIR